MGIMTPADQETAELSIAPAEENRVTIEMAAHRGTIIEIRKDGETWAPVLDGAKNRRLTAQTPMQLTGPRCHETLPKTFDAVRPRAQNVSHQSHLPPVADHRRH